MGTIDPASGVYPWSQTESHGPSGNGSGLNAGNFAKGPNANALHSVHHFEAESGYGPVLTDERHYIRYGSQCDKVELVPKERFILVIPITGQCLGKLESNTDPGQAVKWVAATLQLGV